MKVVVVAVIALICLCNVGDAQFSENTIFDNLSFYPTTHLFFSIINSTGYDTLRTLTRSKDTRATVFAPNNDAIESAIECGYLNPNDTKATTNLFKYHMLDHLANEGDFRGEQYPRTLLNDPSLVQLDGFNQIIKVTYDGHVIRVMSCTAMLLKCWGVVTVMDIPCSNGIIHIIDRVIEWPEPLLQELVSAELDTMVAALTLANLTDCLAAMHSMTLFAPTNEAFSTFPWRTMPIDLLQEILLYHMVHDPLYAREALMDGHLFPTMYENCTIYITRDEYTIRVNSARVITTDILTSSGVLHVVDEVIVPPLREVEVMKYREQERDYNWAKPKY